MGGSESSESKPPSAEEQERLNVLFTKVDVNGNGTLDKEEIRKWQWDDEADIKSVLEKLDANQDANISRAEWDSHWAERKGALSDMDFDNLISQAEAMAKG